MNTPDLGILALWNDCAPGREDLYERWYQGEHLPERLGLAGFIRGRRYEAVDAQTRFFTYYEVESPGVLAADVYRARLNDPTPMTREVMSTAFINMSRTVCTRTALVGRMRGCWAATVHLAEVPSGDWLERCFSAPEWAPRLARAEAWQDAEIPGLGPTVESELRGGGDRSIRACVFVETLREADCRMALALLRERLGNAAGSPGLYRVMCELTAGDAASQPAT